MRVAGWWATSILVIICVIHFRYRTQLSSISWKWWSSTHTRCTLFWSEGESCPYWHSIWWLYPVCYRWLEVPQWHWKMLPFVRAWFRLLLILIQYCLNRPSWINVLKFMIARVIRLVQPYLLLSNPPFQILYWKQWKGPKIFPWKSTGKGWNQKFREKFYPKFI